MENMLCKNSLNYQDAALTEPSVFENDLLEVAKRIKSVRPYAKIAVFCSDDGVNTAIELCGALKKVGHKTALLSCGENFNFSVDGIKDFFALPEDVRAAVVLSRKLLIGVKYFAQIKNTPCYFIPTDGLPCGIYDGVGSILSDGALYKVRLKIPQVIFVKQKTGAQFFKNLSVWLLSRAFALLSRAGLSDTAYSGLVSGIKALACGDYEELLNCALSVERFGGESYFLSSPVSGAAYYAYGNTEPTATICKAVLLAYKQDIKKAEFIPPDFNGTAREISLLTGLSLPFVLQKIYAQLKRGRAEKTVDVKVFGVLDKILKLYEKEYGKIAPPTERERAAARIAVNNFNILV